VKWEKQLKQHHATEQLQHATAEIQQYVASMATDLT